MGNCIITNEIERWTQENCCCVTTNSDSRIKAMQNLLDDYHIASTIGYSMRQVFTYEYGAHVWVELPLQKLRL